MAIEDSISQRSPGKPILLPRAKLEEIKTHAKIPFSLVEKAVGEKGAIFTSVHAWLRTVDDVIDLDSPTPRGMSIAEYLSQKDKLLRDFSNDTPDILAERIDAPLARAFGLARKYSIDITEEMTTQMDLFKTEFERRNNFLVSTREEMLARARSGDRIILSMLLKALGVSDPDSFSLLSLGVVQRADWLADMKDDLSDGLITIPKEDAENLGISLPTGEEFLSNERLKQWYLETYRELLADWERAEATDSATLKRNLSESAYSVFLKFWRDNTNDRLKK